MARCLHFLCIVSLFIVISQTAYSETLIATVAQVKNSVITSRDVEINMLLNQKIGPHLDGISHDEGVEYTIKILLLYFEGVGFYSTPIPSYKVQDQVRMTTDQLQKNPKWKALTVSSAELSTWLTRRLEAERIYSFKRKASVLPVTPAEIELEYRQNQEQYSGIDFKEAREQIRQKKTLSNLQQRMGQWFEVLESKYKVQRFQREP